MIINLKNLSTRLLNLVNSSYQSHTVQLSNDLQQVRMNATCWLCAGHVKSITYQEFCPACQKDLPCIVSKCTCCALPIPLLPDGDSTSLKQSPLICGECLDCTPAFTYTVCSYLYEFPVQQLIQRIKYQQQRYWITPLTRQLAKDIRTCGHYNDSPLPELLIPVPLHPKKRKHRGFNQACLIARQLSLQLDIPLEKRVLIKTSETGNQASLKRQQRISNLKDSIKITSKPNQKLKLIGKHVALVDDVMTTKATAELASKCLLEAGAARVDIWCLARTPKYRNED